MQNLPPRPPVPRWQLLTVYGILFAVPFACVGIALLRLPTSQHYPLLLWVACTVLTILWWAVRKLPHEHLVGRQKKITKPQRITASRALFRCIAFSSVPLIYAVLLLLLVCTQGVKGNLSAFATFLLTMPVFLNNAVQNYRSYRKAKREGPLVINPASLPPHEVANLTSFKTVANLDHAVPESQIARADRPAQTKPSTFVAPPCENEAQPVIIKPR